MQHLSIAHQRLIDPAPSPALGDLRFRALMSEDDWAALPMPIRRRFSKRLSGGKTAVYVGEVLETWMSRAGWCLVQAARLIGAPLPTDRRRHSPSIVTVTEDIASGGQIWTRLYVRNGFPQVIHSAKRFAGVTGLEEYVGYGISMALTIHVNDEALIFRSAGYFLQMFGRRIPLPRWLAPGALSVIHAEVGDGRFSFTLQIAHPRFGLILRQMAIFREVEQ